MSESLKQRPPHSYIPVVTPRQARSTLPSSLSLPQLDLEPSKRRPSGTIPSIGESPASNIQQNSGISSFRSLRNLLPFGSGGKQTTLYSSPASAVNGPKNPFSNFGSVRRSIQGERKNSASFPRLEELQPSPVISIEAPLPQLDTSADHDVHPYDSRSCSGDHAHNSPSRSSIDSRRCFDT